MASRLQRSRGFTLTEILVSIVILGIVAALLYPAVSKAIDQARTTGCLSNLRRIGSAFYQYAADHQGVIPYYPPNGSPHPTWRAYLDPYLGWVDDRSEKSLRFCPLNRDPANRGSSAFHYAMNYGFPGPFWRLSQVGAAPEAFLVGCNAPGESAVRILSNQGAPGGVLGYHHQERAALLFVDGHVEARSAGQLPVKEADPAAWNRFWNPVK